MVDNELMERLFQKRGNVNEEEIKQIEAIVDHVEGKKQLPNDINLNNYFADHKGVFNSIEELEESIKIEKNKIEEIKNIEKVITHFHDEINLAEQILKYIPLHYDKSCLWWRWSFKDLKWEIIDEIDLLNNVSFSSPANTINSKKRGEIIQALKQKARLNKPIEPKLSWIQFGDEVVDIITGDRFKASPRYFLTNPIPHKLGRTKETPNIDRIFADWVGEKNVLLLKEIMAYCILRDYPIHRIFCFIGAGLNGKSKYLEFLRRFVGSDNCCSTELDTLLNSRFEITRLHKKLVCQMGETNFNEMSKTSQLKKLSGGDLIGFEYKNKNPFEEINYAKILIATNNLPATSDKTKGFYRRWIIIDFPNEFSEKKDILSEIPEIEYNNLANQLVSVLMDLITKREFHNEGSIEERMKRYEDHSNPLEKFWNENIIECYDSHIYKHDFRKRIVQWCKENRFREVSDTSISKLMKQKEVQEKKIQADWYENDKKIYVRAWIGIKFR